MNFSKPCNVAKVFQFRTQALSIGVRKPTTELLEVKIMSWLGETDSDLAKKSYLFANLAIHEDNRKKTNTSTHYELTV